MPLLNEYELNRLPVHCIFERGMETAERIANREDPANFSWKEIKEMADVAVALRNEIKQLRSNYGYVIDYD
jgi:hypothetical protein